MHSLALSILLIEIIFFQEDYTTCVEKIKWNHDIPKEYLSSTEIKQLASTPYADNPDVYRAGMFSIYTGLRRSDILALRWENIHHERGRKAYISQQELPDVKESDIEGAVDFLVSLPYVDNDRIGGLGICGSGSYMSVAGVKEPRLKAITAIVPAIADISKSAMAGFFRPEDEVKAAKKAYEQGKGGLMHLNFMPRAFDEGAAYYYSSRGTHPRWSNQVVAWSQLELVKYNVVNIMKDMKKPYLVITGENAWSREASTEVFNAVPHTQKEMHVIPEASHFDMYDLAPFVSEAFEFIIPFFNKNL